MRHGAVNPVAEARRFLSALQFLTRLPVPDPGWEEGRLRLASRYFGAVGLIVGAIAALVWAGAALVLPPMVAALLATSAAILVSGGLHEDGFADTADGLLGTRDRQRALEIMRDSRIGTYGALALVLSVGLRAAALGALPMAEGMLALILASTTGRALMVPAIALAPYARNEGLGRGVEGAGATETIAAASTAGLVSLFAGASGLLALVVAAVLAWGLLLWMRRRLGGYTGDCLGAIAVTGETAVLVTLAGAWA
ncbi:MAG: adenosylcobinamide-GDP ribazoletransferase [Pseudomonadota bacterium]